VKKKSYIDSKSNQISLAAASLQNKQLWNRIDKQLWDQIDQLVQEKLQLFRQEIRAVIEQHHDPQLPLSIFKSAASTLEVIVKYLHEAEQLNFADIAKLLNRDQRTVWHAYQRSLRKGIRPRQEKSAEKRAEKPAEKSVEKSTEKKAEKSTKKIADTSSITIPVSLFARRQFSPLEVLVSCLHQQQHLSFAEISRALLLSPKTVWTVYRRYQRKLNQEQHHKNQDKNHES